MYLGSKGTSGRLFVYFTVTNRSFLNDAIYTKRSQSFYNTYLDPEDLGAGALRFAPATPTLL